MGGYLASKILCNVARQKTPLFERCARFAAALSHRFVCCSHDQMLMPGNCKEHATILGLRDHQRTRAGEEIFRQHQMRALTESERDLLFGRVHLKDFFREYTCGVDDDRCTHVESLTTLEFDRGYAFDLSTTLNQSSHFHVVESDSTEVFECPCECGRVPRIVELAVAVENAAL